MRPVENPTNASALKKRLNFSNYVVEGEKQRTAEDSEDLENSFEQLEIDRVEEPTRKRGRPKKILVEAQPARRRGRPGKII